MLSRPRARAAYIARRSAWRFCLRPSSSQAHIAAELSRGPSPSPAPSPAPAAEIKSYDAILREMESRSTQWDEPSARINTHFLNRLCAVDELYKPLNLGDIVLLNLDPVVIIGTPDVPDGTFVVADAVGRAKEVFRGKIDARLMSFVDPAHIRGLQGRLFAADSMATDSALEPGVAPSVTTSATTSRVVSQPVHGLVARPLRRFYNDAMKRAQRLLPQVTAALRQREMSPRAVTMSFADLVLEVCPTGAPLYSIADFYAVRLCLDHYTLVHKYLLDFSYTGKYALTVLPQATQARNLDVIYGHGESAGFLADYASENIPSNEGESRAIELLRSQYPEADRIDAGGAAELLRLPLGGVSHKLRYSWFTQARAEIAAPKTADQMQGLRRDFNQPVYCIDSAGALEIDDGISLQRLGPDSTNGPNSTFRLGVHIANPSAFTTAQSLTTKLLQRPTTVYETNGSAIPMLPRALTRELDLVAGQRRPALSLFVDLDLDTMQTSNVKLKSLMLSQIVNKTPDEVDNSRDDFADFARVAEGLRAQRRANGAFETAMSAPESFASVIVSEFMLMANHRVAEFCRDREIPLLYRGQRVLAQSEPLRQAYEAALRDSSGRLGFEWRPVMQKSVVSVVPRPHAGIGYGATTRFTSPLRRLEDYITHSQVEAHLRGAALPFSTHDLARMVPWLQASQELVREYQRKLAMYDVLESLQPGESVDGVVSQVPWGQSAHSTHSALATPTRVYLPAYGIEAEYAGATELAIGDPIRVVLRCIYRHAGLVSVTLPGERFTRDS